MIGPRSTSKSATKEQLTVSLKGEIMMNERFAASRLTCFRVEHLSGAIMLVWLTPALAQRLRSSQPLQDDKRIVAFERTGTTLAPATVLLDDLELLGEEPPLRRRHAW